VTTGHHTQTAVYLYYIMLHSNDKAELNRQVKLQAKQ